MPSCGVCGKPLTCGCNWTSRISQTFTNCPKPGTLWVHVVDDLGKGLGDLSIRAVNDEWRRTDSSGLIVYEDVPKGTYPVEIKDYRDPSKRVQDLPEKPKLDAQVNDGRVTLIPFTLRRRAKLKVEVRGKAEVVAAATVHARRFQTTSNGSGGQTLVTGEEGQCVDGKIDFGLVPSGRYRVSVTPAGLHPDDYEANEADIDVPAGGDETVILHVEVIFRKVRFIGYCLATVCKQIWTGDDALVQAFRLTDAHKDGDHESAYDWWQKRTAQAKASWKVQYTGKRSDREDIEARIGTLKAAIAAAEGLLGGTTEDELKVFVAPECFFLGRYGAYELDSLGRLIEGLQELVRDAKWKSWIFVFGTVNGCYQSDGTWEMFNISPVIKGGFEWDDPSLYTLLRRKQIFSQEIPGTADLEHHAEQDRTPLTEDLVGMGFGPTENETKLGGHIEKLLRDLPGMPDPLVAELTKTPDWEPRRWAAIRKGTREDIQGRTLKRVAADLKSRQYGPDKAWMIQFREALEAYLGNKGSSIAADVNLEKGLEDFRKVIAPETAGMKTGVSLDGERWRMVKVRGDIKAKKLGMMGIDGLVAGLLAQKVGEDEWEADIRIAVEAYLGKQSTSIAEFDAVSKDKWKDKLMEFFGCILVPTAGGATGLKKTSAEWVELRKGIDREIEARGAAMVAADLREEMFVEKRWMPDLRAALEKLTGTADLATLPNLEGEIEKILAAIEKEEEVAGLAGWTAVRWKAVRDESANRIAVSGLTRLVRAVRKQNVQTETFNRTLPETAWLADLRFAVREKILPEDGALLRQQAASDFRYEDYCFSTKRIPGPWLGHVVFPSDPIPPGKKLNFVLETCADHLNRRAIGAMSGLGEKPAVDIHLVPSAGAQLGAANVCVERTGFAFNCDGWNAPMFAAGPRERKALVIRKVVDPNVPWNSGNNPLFPHSELWKMAGGKATTIAGTAHKFVRDITGIFASEGTDGGEIHVYPAQDLPRV